MSLTFPAAVQTWLEKGRMCESFHVVSMPLGALESPSEAAITFPTSAFCLLGTFAPDNGQFLAPLAWLQRGGGLGSRRV